jgi:hypothetical protein
MCLKDLRTREDHSDHTKFAFYTPDKDLPAGYLSMAGPQVPLHANLFTLCCRSAEKAWLLQRNVVVHTKDLTLPSLGWEWL